MSERISLKAGLMKGVIDEETALDKRFAMADKVLSLRQGNDTGPEVKPLPALESPEGEQGAKTFEHEPVDITEGALSKSPESLVPPVITSVRKKRHVSIMPFEPVNKVTFSWPLEDIELLDALFERCLEKRVVPNKSEIARAGLKALSNMKDTEFVATMRSVRNLKRGGGAKK